MVFVMDASIILSWCFQDEASEATWSLLDSLALDSAMVPVLWHMEVGNILLQAQKKGRLTEARVTEFCELLESLPIEIDAETSHRTFRQILPLARSQQLTVYDATYLELAMRLGVPLASKDEVLRQAAQHLGVPVLP